MLVKLFLFFNYFRSFIPYLFLKNNKILIQDLEVWKCNYHMDKKNNCYCFNYMMSFFPEFRTLVLYRTKYSIIYFLIKLTFKPMTNLYINVDEGIGEGFFIQHGFSTIISAKKIGKNFWCNQQVTIGYNGDKKPLIGDNVKVYAGSIVIGGVVIGNNCVVGAGTVVNKNLESDSVYAGVPAKKIGEYSDFIKKNI